MQVAADQEDSAVSSLSGSSSTYDLHARHVTRLRRQLEEKYFDYNGVSPDCPDNLEKNT
jgi:hypothetical protein